MFDLSVLIIALLGTPALIRFMQRASDPSLDRQILTVSGITLLIHVSAVLSPITNKNLPWILFWSGVVITIFVYSLNRVLSSRTVEPARISVKKRNVRLISPQVIALFVGVLVLRLWMLGTVLSGDHTEYYAYLIKACRQFDFSPQSVLYFDLCGHASYGFALLFAPGVFLFPNCVPAVQLLEMVVAAICAVCLYSVIKNISPSSSNSLALLAGFTVVSLPINWIMSQGFAPDYGLVVFFILMLYCDVTEKPILTFFCALLLGFSKEPAWVIVISYGVTKGLVLVSRGTGPLRKRFVSAVVDNRILPFFSTCVIGLVYFLTMGVGWTAGRYYSAESVNAGSWSIDYNTFGFDSGFALTRFLEVFIVNFTWLFTLLLIVASTLLVNQASKSRKATKLGLHHAGPGARSSTDEDTLDFRVIIIPCIASLASYTSFMMLSISACTLRYTAIASSLVVIIFFLALTRIKRIGRERLLRCSFFATSFIILQSFMPLDILTNYFFEPISIGNTSVLCIAQPTNSEPGRDYYYCNLQCLWLDKAIETMLNNCSYKDNDLIMVAGDSFTSAEANGIRTEVNGRLCQTDSSKDANRLKRYDQSSGRYVNNFDPTPSNIVTISTNAFFGYSPLADAQSLSEEQMVKNASSQTQAISGRVILYFSPLNDIDEDETLDSLRPYFFIGERQIAGAFGGELVYYILEPKPALYGYSDFSGSVPIVSSLIQGETIPVDTSNGVISLYDLSTIYRVPQSTEADITNTYFALLDSELTDVSSDDRRILIREGDAVACRVRIEKDGELLRYAVEPSGILMTTLYAGHDGYLNDLGNLIVGMSLGDEIVFSTDEVSPWMSDAEQGSTYTYSVVPTDIVRGVPELTDSFFQTIGFATKEEYLQEVIRISNTTFSVDALYHSCYLVSDYVPDSAASEYYSEYIFNMFKSKADAIGTDIDEFVRVQLNLSMEDFTQFCREYGEYLAIINAINHEYLNYHIYLNWRVPS